MKFLENIGMSKYTIKLKKGKQLLFGPIYSLKPIELKALKIYIKINLANNFIQSFKSLSKVLTLFNKKSDQNFRYYIDYLDLNNLNIKNYYLLSLINKLLDQLNRAKQFI